jgi:hypothetical protein
MIRLLLASDLVRTLETRIAFLNTASADFPAPAAAASAALAVSAVAAAAVSAD